MDISKLNNDIIEDFGCKYFVAKYQFDVEPEKATPKMQRKIYKWLYKVFFIDYSENEEQKAILNSFHTNAELFDFMYECSKACERIQERKKQEFNDVTADFSFEVKKAFEELSEDGYIPEDGVIVIDNTLSFDLSGFGYHRQLILTTDKTYSFNEFNYFLLGETKLNKTVDGYVLSFPGELKEDYNDSENTESTKQVEIFFTDAKVQIDLCRSDLAYFNSPWEFLTLFVSEIIGKASLGEQYLNEKENALLPLLKEISAMWYYDRKTDSNVNFSNIIPLLEKHKLKSVIKALEKVRKKGSALHILNIQQKLNRAKTEPLWREIYEKIVDSQKDYPESAELYQKYDVEKVRARVEKKMHELGYEGSYPDFYKNGAMKGIHLVSSYNMSYWVGTNNNTKYFVKCLEYISDYSCQITFLSGTALLKRGETAEDVFSCTFNHNGKRFFKTEEWMSDAMGSLEHFVSIATKKAECKKLDKIEKSLINTPISFSHFFSMLFFFGTLFAIGFNLLFFLFVCILEVFIDKTSTFSEMLYKFPFMYSFIFCFFGFGVTMAIIETLAKRK